MGLVNTTLSVFALWVFAPAANAQECDTDAGQVDLGIIFENITLQAGVRGYANSLGATMNDLDGDGDIDIYSLSGPSRAEESMYYNGESLLFLNDGDMVFSEAGREWGLDDLCEDRAVMFGDLNNDFLPDMYITVNGRNLVYRNYGDGDFRDVTPWSGQADQPGWGHQGFLFDYDRDGYLDVFFTNGPEDGSGFNSLLHNQGDGTFGDVSDVSGVAGDPSGKGSCVLDANVDGWPDIFVATGREFGNHLFINQGDGTFDDQALEWGISDPFQRFGIGPSCGDINNDGLPDIFLITHDKWFSGNNLFINHGGYFTDQALEYGINEFVDGHGNAIVDIDNDGFLDFVLSGIGTQPYLLLNNQNDSFSEVCFGGGISQQNGLTWAVIPGDMNADGYPEIYITNGLGRRPGENNLFVHSGDFGNHYLTLDVRGITHNPSQIGAKIEVDTGDMVITRWVGTWSSFDSQGPLPVTVGLGDTEVAQSVTVTFTNGTTLTLNDVKADQILLVEEPVDEYLDADFDGVQNDWDICDFTPVGHRTDGEGCAPEQRGGLSIALQQPVTLEIVTAPPTFVWTSPAISAVVQLSVSGSFGPAGRFDFGPTATGSYTLSEAEWQEVLAETNGTKPMVWRVIGLGEEGETGTTDPRSMYGAKETSLIYVPEGANEFTPSHIVVDKGTTVTFTNDAVSAGNIQNEIHDIQLMDGMGRVISDKIDLNGGDDFIWTFDEVGTYSMVCHRHAGVAHHTDSVTEGAIHMHGHATNQYHCMSGTVTVR